MSKACCGDFVARNVGKFGRLCRSSRQMRGIKIADFVL